MQHIGTVVRKLLDALSIAIVGLALVLVVGRLLYGSRTRERLDAGAFFDLLRDGNRLGPELAPVEILVYSDYQCGFCKELNATLDTLRHRYPQHLAVIIKSFVKPEILEHFRVPLGAECAAEQGKFAEYHAAAFRNSEVLSYSQGWRIIGDSAGIIERDAFTRCVEARRYATKLALEYEEGERLGVAVTPTLFVNGLPVVGAAPLVVLDSLVAMQFPNR